MTIYLFYESPGSLVAGQGKAYFFGGWVDFHSKIFPKGTAAVITGLFANSIINFRGMDDDYGFLPYPLFNDS